ncbi:GTPase-activating protein, partial [Ascosphaera pollenicola]
MTMQLYHVLLGKNCADSASSVSMRGDMRYDVEANRRNPIVIESINQQIALARTKSEATKLRKEFGISERGTPIEKICNVYSGASMLPLDPCHSELAGVSKVALATLLEDMMTATEKEQFLTRLHVFPMRQGWAKIDSPITFLQSLRLQEIGRLSLITPLILMFSLDQTWIVNSVAQGLAKTSNTIFAMDTIAVNNVACVSHQTPQSGLHELVISSRKEVQALLEAAAHGYEQVKSAAISQVDACSDLGRPVKPQAKGRWGGKKLQAYSRMKERPNMHIRLHHQELANECSVINNCTVFACEDKHRWFKRVVQNTNHKDVEKVLPIKEGLQKVLSFTLDGAYATERPMFTSRLQRLHSVCPTLFNEANETGITLQNRVKAGQGQLLLGIPTTNLRQLRPDHPFIKKIKSTMRQDRCDGRAIAKVRDMSIVFWQKATYDTG